jgi:UDP-glucose 4-epimerase
MNILIIGGAGYIGSHVAKEFLERGCRVTVYDNLSSGLRENIVALASGNFTFIHGDIHDDPGLTTAMKSG